MSLHLLKRHPEVGMTYYINICHQLKVNLKASISTKDWWLDWFCASGDLLVHPERDLTSFSHLTRLMTFTHCWNMRYVFCLFILDKTRPKLSVIIIAFGHTVVSLSEEQLEAFIIQSLTNIYWFKKKKEKKNFSRVGDSYLIKIFYYFHQGS